MTRTAKQISCYFMCLGLMLGAASYAAAAENVGSPGFFFAPSADNGTPAPESSAPEAAAPKAAAPESVTPEAAAPKAAAPKAAMSEAVAPKAATPESVRPKAAARKAAALESVTPEAVAPKAAAPESVMPKAAAPKAAAPKAAMSEAVAPKAAAPESVMPKAAAPKAAARKAAAFESSAPDVAMPQPGKRELCASGPAPKVEEFIEPGSLDPEVRVDLQCLKTSYPQITGLVSDAEGLWLLLGDKGRVLYARHASSGSAAGGQNMGEVWDVDVRTSMAAPYPLEPGRPDTPYGVSPGRKRSYEFLVALYGGTPAQVSRQLVPARLVGQPLRLSAVAGMALAGVDTALVEAVRQDPQLRKFLKVEGGFMWRRIAGESRLSPHAFGIAIDLSSHAAPYWRWSKLRPHPLQFSYPTVIVDAMEQAGFIWGGKWHEYDIMHFEYRPEIICKARALRDRVF